MASKYCVSKYSVYVQCEHRWLNLCGHPGGGMAHRNFTHRKSFSHFTHSQISQQQAFATMNCSAAILRIWRHPRRCFNQALAGCQCESDLDQASGSFVSWNLSNTKSWLFHFATLCDTWECLCNFKYVIHGSVYATLYIMGMFIVYALLLCFHRPATQICPTWVRVCVLDNIFTMYETLFWSTRR